MDMQTSFMFSAELMEKIGCKRTTLYHLIKKGAIPAPVSDFGGIPCRRRWRREEITNWIKNGGKE